MAILAAPNYDRLKAERTVTMWGGLTGAGALGIQNTATPQADEINGVGGSGVLNWSPSISWNDLDFGVQESESINDPSLADESTYVEFGAKNYGGGISFYYPKEYDDNSNNHSLVYDQTDIPRTKIDIAQRIDGDVKTSVPATDGDFIHTFRTITDAETNVLAQPDAYRRTVGFNSQGDAEFYTLVGAHSITVAPNPVTPWKAGSKNRLRAIVQDRDYTVNVSFSSSDPSVVNIFPGGFYEVTGTSGDTATITIRDEAAGTSATESVTVTA